MDGIPIEKGSTVESNMLEKEVPRLIDPEEAAIVLEFVNNIVLGSNGLLALGAFF